MSENTRSSKPMKSAYELALERMEEQGIDRPREDGLDSSTRDEIAEIRRTYEAKFAELEILLRDHLKSALEPAARREAEETYRRERARLTEKRDAEIEAARARS